MAGYIGGKAVNLSTSGADISGTANLDIVDIDGAVNMATTALVTGVLTANGGAVFNEGSADVDFRVESNGNANMLFVDGGNNRVGIGTSSPSANLDVASSNATIHLTDTDDTTYAEIRNNGGTFTIASDEGAAASNSSINFRVDGTQRMVIDSSGNVGIGTSSPEANLEIQSGDNAKLRLQTTSGTDRKLNIGVTDSTNAIINVESNQALEFHTNNTERMRIDNSGNLLVGTTSQTTTGVGGATFLTASVGRRILALGSTSAGSGVELVHFYNPNGRVGRIETNASSTSYITSSDYRLKTDAQPMTGASARVQALNPVNFEWIVDGSRVDGFLAHEAQEIVPEAVTGTKDGMMDEEYQVSAATGDIYTPATDEADEVIHSADVEQPETLEDGQQWRETTAAVMGTRSVPDMQGIDQSKMVPLLVAALQEALARITALENA